MTKNIAILAIALCLASTSSALAREKNHGKHGGYNKKYHHRPHYNHGYHNRGYRGGGHHDDGLEFVVGVAGGLLLGSALMYSATPPPPQTVIYGTPSTTTYQPPVIVQQPKICVQERTVNGQWQINQYDGSKVWVSFPYPVTERVQVPCY